MAKLWCIMSRLGIKDTKYKHLSEITRELEQISRCLSRGLKRSAEKEAANGNEPLMKYDLSKDQVRRAPFRPVWSREISQKSMGNQSSRLEVKKRMNKLFEVANVAVSSDRHAETWRGTITATSTCFKIRRDSIVRRKNYPLTIWSGVWWEEEKEKKRWLSCPNQRPLGVLLQQRGNLRTVNSRATPICSSAVVTGSYEGEVFASDSSTIRQRISPPHNWFVAEIRLSLSNNNLGTKLGAVLRAARKRVCAVFPPRWIVKSRKCVCNEWNSSRHYLYTVGRSPLWL